MNLSSFPLKRPTGKSLLHGIYQFKHVKYLISCNWPQSKICVYLRCLHSFLKIEVDLCFKFDLREVLDIRDFLKETTGALKLKFNCSVVPLSCVNLYRKYSLIVCRKWINLNLYWLTFRSISEILSYEHINDLMSLLTISFEHIHVLWEHTGGQSVYVRILFITLP